MHHCANLFPSLSQASARGAAVPDRGVPAAAQRRVHPGDEQAHDGGAGAKDLRARSQARTGKKEEFSAVATLKEISTVLIGQST